MKLLLTVALISFFSSSFSQTINRDLLDGKWLMEGVMVNDEVVTLSSADALSQKFLASEAAEQQAPLTKEDSALIKMSANMLCGLMNGMEMDAGKKGKLVLTFHTDMFGKKEDKIETLTYVFKDDHTITTTDSKGKQADLTIITLNEKSFVFSGLGSAKTMQLHFKRM